MPRSKKQVRAPIRWRDADRTRRHHSHRVGCGNGPVHAHGQRHPASATQGWGLSPRSTRLSVSSVKKGIKGLESKSLLEHKRRWKSKGLNDSNYYSAIGVGRSAPEGMAQGDQRVGRRGRLQSLQRLFRTQIALSRRSNPNAASSLGHLIWRIPVVGPLQAGVRRQTYARSTTWNGIPISSCS